MPDVIHLLPDSVANQIAAGEVIQRPASALKEMLENAIDAGALAITVIIRDAGRTLLQVIDDGCGMSETDARMSFERHSTSKISAARDLFAIRTLGFRGEALASIAAVAQVEMKTKRLEDELGTLLEIEGSRVRSQTPCTCPAGTSVAVKNLFFNVPARRNFLKSDHAETRHLLEEFQRVALIHHDIAFTYYNNNALVFQLDKSSLKSRITGILGHHYNERLVPVSEKTEIVTIGGFISKPQYARKTRGEQYFFVNKRYIRQAYLHHAVEAAYQELIPKEAYATYFINLEVHPSTIDINIHPTKTEINFQHQQAIYAILRSAVKKALGSHSLSPAIDFDPEQSIKFEPFPESRPVKPPVITINPDYNPFEETTRKQPPSSHPATHGQRQTGEKIKPEHSRQHKNWQALYDFPDTDTLKKILRKKTTDDATQHALVDSDWSYADNKSGDIIFQIKNAYIIANLKSGLLFIDQQAAHQRILFERFMEELTMSTEVSQQLLYAQTIRFSPVDTDIIKELLQDIRSMGFQISEFGRNTFLVEGVPAGLKIDDTNEFLEHVLEDYRKGADLAGDKKRRLARSMALHASIKPGLPLTVEEMNNLIDGLFACKVPDVSPDQAPIFFILHYQEIEKRLKNQTDSIHE